MIHVDRGKAPSVLSSIRLRKLRQELKSFFSTPKNSRKSSFFRFPPVTKLPGVKRDLRRTFNSKCGYCESIIAEDHPGQLDSFRPKQRAVGLDGSIDEDHYWWLAYEWSNMIASCLTCNRLKAT